MWTSIKIVFCCVLSVWASVIRLPEHARAFYENAAQYIVESNEQRFMFEESPHYETGYLVHEIIERYRKLILHTLRMNDTQYRLLKEDYFDALEPLEHTQKLYLEIYHLCNMVHEIPKKWTGLYDDFTGMTKKEQGISTGKPYSEYLEQIVKHKEYEKKKRLKAMKKFMKKQREKHSMGNVLEPPSRIPGARKEPYNSRWPHDYGWEPEFIGEIN